MDDEPESEDALSFAEQLLPEEIGRTPMISKVAEAVKVAMQRAGISDPADVHYVQTKTPLLTISGDLGASITSTLPMPEVQISSAAFLVIL